MTVELNNSLINLVYQVRDELYHVGTDATRGAVRSAIYLTPGVGIGMGIGATIVGTLSSLWLLVEESPLTAAGIVAIATAGVAGVAGRVRTLVTEVDNEVNNRLFGNSFVNGMSAGVFGISVIEVMTAMMTGVQPTLIGYVIRVVGAGIAGGTIESVATGILQRQGLLPRPLEF